MLRVNLVALDDELAESWSRWCGDLEFVSVHRGSILDLECDAVVSPANSFGFMDGGIDAVYTRHFGSEVQERRQEAIRAHHQGELLVGTADVVSTGDDRIPFLIAAPTMRVPMILKDTVHPYLAARAALLLVESGIFATGPHTGRRVNEHIRSVAFPGLGTGVGRVSADTCARQMRAALDDVFGARTFPASWWEAQRRHQGLYCGQHHDLQFDPEEESPAD